MQISRAKRKTFRDRNGIVQMAENGAINNAEDRLALIPFLMDNARRRNRVASRVTRQLPTPANDATTNL